MIDYKKEVLKVYPDAYIDEFYRLETLFRVKVGEIYLGEWCYTEQQAHKSAYEKLVEQGLIPQN